MLLSYCAKIHNGNHVIASETEDSWLHRDKEIDRKTINAIHDLIALEI